MMNPRMTLGPLAQSRDPGILTVCGRLGMGRTRFIDHSHAEPAAAKVLAPDQVLPRRFNNLLGHAYLTFARAIVAHSRTKFGSGVPKCSPRYWLLSTVY